MREYGVKEPLHFFLSNFPAPTINDKDKPWRKNKHLSEQEFQEECRRWDVQEVVFTGIWKIYHPLMRADFCLFDSYENDLKEKTFASDVTAFHGTEDFMITKNMVEQWETMTTGAFALERRKLRLGPVSAKQEERKAQELKLLAIRKEAGVSEVLEDRPQFHNCPISCEPMVDPVVAADGFSYERAAIERWLADGERASPVTREPLATLALLPNTTLRELIAELCAPGGASDGVRDDRYTVAVASPRKKT